MRLGCLGGAALARLSERMRPSVRSVAGAAVGEIRPAAMPLG